MSTSLGIDNIGRKKFDLSEYNDRAAQQQLTSADVEQIENKRRKLAGMDITQTLQRHNVNDVKNKISHSLGVTRVSTSSDAGIRCELCEITLKDSRQYINHINSIQHLKMLGMSNKIIRSSTLDVKLKLYEHEKELYDVNDNNHDITIPGVYQPQRLIDWSDIIEMNSNDDKCKIKNERTDDHSIHAKLESETIDANDTETSASLPIHTDTTIHNDYSSEEQSDMAAMMGFYDFGSSKQKR